MEGIDWRIIISRLHSACIQREQDGNSSGGWPDAKRRLLLAEDHDAVKAEALKLLKPGIKSFAIPFACFSPPLVVPSRPAPLPPRSAACPFARPLEHPPLTRRPARRGRPRRPSSLMIAHKGF